jgi:hypothetical protein
MSSRTSHSDSFQKSTRRSRRNGARRRAAVAARSRRFSPEEHAHALSLIAAGMKRDEVASSVGCTTGPTFSRAQAGTSCGSTNRLRRGLRPNGLAFCVTSPQARSYTGITCPQRDRGSARSS